jgi:hypothetical protein
MKCSLSDIEGLSAQIENLGNLGREHLDQAWRDLFEADRPRRVCGDLLIKALGYRLQEKANRRPQTFHSPLARALWQERVGARSNG